MSRNLIIFLLVLILGYNCKHEDANINNDINISENKDELNKPPIITNPKIHVIDTFKINDYVFVIIKSDSIYTYNDLKYDKKINYLINLKADTIIDYNDIYSILTNAISQFILPSSFIDKKYFFNVTNEYNFKNTIAVRYAYPFPVTNSSENYILYLKNGKLTKLLNLLNWEYYDYGLNPEILSDSIISLQYTSRDRYGHFHPDYFLNVNTINMEINFIKPDKQQFNYSSTTTDTVIVYRTILEAKNKVASKDSFIVELGVKFDFDSVYWNSNVFKVYVPGYGEGFVNMDDDGINIPVDVAG